MNPALTGMLLGLVASAGLLLAVRYAPPFRAVRLVDRLAPYVHDTPPPSRLLGTVTEAGLLTAVRRIFGPVVGDGARLVDRVLGGRAEQPGRRGGVVYVGSEPVDQPHRTERRRVPEHQHQPGRPDQAEQHPQDRGAHDDPPPLRGPFAPLLARWRWL